MTLLAICIGIILNFCSVQTFIYSDRVIRKNGSLWKVLAIYALIIILASVATRYIQQENPNALALVALMKFTASLPTVLFALKGYLIQPTWFGRFIFLAIVMGMIADIAININLLAGGAFFLAGHLLYDFAFISERKPSSRQVALWLILSALMIIPLRVIMAQIGFSNYFIGGWIYLVVLISTVVFARSLGKNVFVAALVFAFSDCFMLANSAISSNIIMKILALDVYYGSLILYGMILWKRSL